MPDIIDIANAETERALQNILANRQLETKPSEIECLECGEPIPEKRRNIGGVTHCIDCATVLENKRTINQGVKRS